LRLLLQARRPADPAGAQVQLCKVGGLHDEDEFLLLRSIISHHLLVQA